MRPACFVELTVLFVVLGAARTRGADSPSVSILKQRGLTKSGITFVVEAEKVVLTKVKELKAIFASYVEASEQRAVAEQVATRVAQLEAHRVELQANLNDMNQHINDQAYTRVNNSPLQGPNMLNQRSMTPQMMIAQRNLIKGALEEISIEQKSLKAHAPQLGDRPALDEDVKEKGEACKAAIEELKPMVADVVKKYAALRADVSVKAAIDELAKAAKANLKLGPSTAFKSGVKALDEAERRLLRKPTASRSKKRGKSKK